MNIHAIYRPISRYFRAKRMAEFAERFHVNPDNHILDVGGTPFNWTLLSAQPQITLINYRAPERKIAGFTYVIADARKLPFADQSFDVVYSNSVIEHLGNLQNQKMMANEIDRVGKQYYVQTPNKYFPIEPHYLAPFIHWLPKTIQPVLVRYCTPRGWLDKSSLKACANLVEEIRLIKESEFQKLFPHAQIWCENFLGLVKSLMAVRVIQN